MTWKRVATAVMLIPAVVALVLWSSTAFVSLAIALIILLALFEYFALGDAIGHRAYRFWTATCALCLVFVQWWAVTVSKMGVIGLSRMGLPSHPRVPEFLLWLPPVPSDVFFLFLLGVALITLCTRRPMVEALPAAGISSSGLLLVALPLTFAIRLHGIQFIGPSLLLYVLVITWVGDTAAYIVGRSIGKHKLAPVLSPGKTWEGAIASLAAVLLFVLVISRWTNFPLRHLLGMASAANIAGQMGDLLESAYKRSAGVKDSGSLLPGHGGVLDRVDALILAIPVVWYYWIWIYSPRT